MGGLPTKKWSKCQILLRNTFFSFGNLIVNILTNEKPLFRKPCTYPSVYTCLRDGPGVRARCRVAGGNSTPRGKNSPLPLTLTLNLKTPTRSIFRGGGNFPSLRIVSRLSDSEGAKYFSIFSRKLILILNLMRIQNFFGCSAPE